MTMGPLPCLPSSAPVSSSNAAAHGLEVERALVRLDVAGEAVAITDHRLHLVERQLGLLFVAGEDIALAADHAFEDPEHQRQGGEELGLAVLARDPQPQPSGTAGPRR
jgi:hypothetical protein